jgi:hypothetical protein
MNQQHYLSVSEMTLNPLPCLDFRYQVLVDGYVSGCHGPPQAERYFKCLLKSDTVSASHHSGRDGDSFVVTSVPPYIRSQLPNQYAWVLDRRVMDAGSVVPQTLWTPHTITDRRHHVEEAELQMPIFFLHTDGRLGLPLEAAVAGHCHSLVNAQIPAPLGPQATTHIRIGVSDTFSCCSKFTIY